MPKVFKTLAINFAIICLLSCGDNNSETSLFPFAADGKYQAINNKGKEVYKSDYSFIGVYSEDLALYRPGGEENLLGFINSKGEVEIEAAYKSALNFVDGVAIVVKENHAPCGVNKKGEIIFEMCFAEMVREFSDGMAAFAVKNEDGQLLWGFINTKGEIVIKPQYTEVGVFSEKLCPVRNEEEWGYINKKGDLEINYQFAYARQFHDGLAIVSTGSDNSGVIDKKGSYAINPQFDWMKIDGDLFMVQKEGEIGWVSRKGKYLINPQYDYARGFNGSKLAPVRMDDEDWGYINRKGEYEINPQFDYAFAFDGDVAVVRSGSKFGLINQKGKFVVNPQFSEITRPYKYYHELLNEHRYYALITDFFNIGAIVDSIQSYLENEKFSGVDFSDTLGGILNTFGMDGKNYTQYGQQYQVFEKTISGDAKISFAVQIPAYKAIKEPYQRYNRTYYKTRYVLDSTAYPKSFKYKLQVYGRGQGKQDQVIDAICKSLPDYKREGEEKNGKITYKNGKYLLDISKARYGNNIELKFTEI